MEKNPVMGTQMETSLPGEWKCFSAGNLVLTNLLGSPFSPYHDFIAFMEQISESVTLSLRKQEIYAEIIAGSRYDFITEH